MSNQSVTVRVKSVRLLLPLVGVGEFPGGGMLCSPYRVSASRFRPEAAEYAQRLGNALDRMAEEDRRIDKNLPRR